MNNNQIEPTPKQIEFVTSTAKFSCFSGGFGCVAGETKIFNPVTGKHIRIDKLDQTHVYSKKIFGYGVNWATRPKKYKKAKLYKIKTQSGKSIIATKAHKFLGEDGLYYPVSALKSGSVRVLVYGGFDFQTVFWVLKSLFVSLLSLPASIWGIYQSILSANVHYCLDKVRDFLKNCLKYFRLYDVSLQQALNTSLNTFPLQVDALIHTHQFLQKDDWEQEYIYKFFHKSHVGNDSHRAKSHSVFLLEHPAVNEEDYVEQTTFELLFEISPRFSQFLWKKVFVRKVLLFYLKFRGALLTYWYNHTLRYEYLSSIKYERTDYYYDLHVPHFNNYFAQGFVNHNSGKTLAGCLRGLVLSGMPGNFGLVGRNTYVELRDTTRRTFFEVCPPEYYDESQGGQWKPSENHIKLINGSEIIFRHLDTISEKELLSLNLGWFFIDQAEEIGERVFQILQSRLRLNIVPNRFGFIVCNPEPGNWIYNKFVKPRDNGKPLADHHLVEASSYENPYLPKDYLPTLLATYPEEMQKRFIEGRWDVFENQIYTEFDRKIHVIKPFEIPKGWEKIVAVDHGMVNPTAAIWGAIDFDGNCVAPWTKLLTADLNWVAAETVKKGDILLGFDEQVPETKKRRWKESVVESVKRVIKPAYKLTLSDGNELVCSYDHQWLVETLGRRRQWRSTEDLKIGWKLLRVSDVWEKDEAWGSGYLAGAFDGEGCLLLNGRGTIALNIVQKNNGLLARVKKELDSRNIHYGIYTRGKDDVLAIQLTRKHEVMRLLGSIRPERLLPKFKPTMLRGFSAFETPTIVKKEFIGTAVDVVSIQTSTRTYIAEGIASHNCIIYDEYYAPGIVSQHAKEILYKTGDDEISLWLIDTSTTAKTREKNGMPWSVIEEYEDYGLYFVPANNEKLAGINRIKEFLKLRSDRRHLVTKQTPAPKLYIFQNCINLLQELPQYQWRKLRSLAQRNSPEQPRDFNDHACFCQHTEVLTQRGTLPIIKVKKGDKVWTPLGWSKVIRKEKTGVKNVITFRSTKATGNHPLLTQDGFRPLSDLKETDRLWNVFTSVDERTGGIQIHQDFPMQSIFAVVGRRMESAQAHYTSMYGNSLKGIFQKSIMFIIKIKIMIETILRILSFIILPYILKSIGKQIVKMEREILRLQENMQSFGIKVLLLRSFIGVSEKKHGKIPLFIYESVKTVNRIIQPMTKTPTMQNTVASIAKCPCTEKTVVYNLVTDTGMFTANNAVVSNCDSLRYLIMSRFPAPLKRPTGQELILPEHRRNANLMTDPFPKNFQGDEMLGQFYGQGQENSYYDSGEDI